MLLEPLVEITTPEARLDARYSVAMDSVDVQPSLEDTRHVIVHQRLATVVPDRDEVALMQLRP